MELNTNLNWPPAPQWALLVGELGRWLILGGVAAFALSALAWALSRRKPALAAVGRWAFTIGALCVVGAFLGLGALFVNEQFEFNSVRQSIETGLPVKYRIAAIWAHQEGSFLLWALTSSIFGLLAVRGTGIYRRWFTVAYSLFLGSLCGILAYETPFALTLSHGKALIPPNGAGLTPSLQNYWVVIHPPTIFTGFGSLTVLFAFAVAAMLTGDVSDWVKRVRPWALISVSVLGLGLCMGGFWAYETLGWGGFWAWDPVEDVSFVPWIMAATFVHGLIVQSNRGRWVSTNLLLGGIPFLAFVYGTFLTRSGLYANVSVHSFAEMDKSALKILLGLLVVSVLAFGAIWVARGRKRSPEAPLDASADREGLYRSGMLMLGGIGVATAIGMSVPLLMALVGKQAKVVEEHLYHEVLVWPFVPLLLLMALAPFASWRGSGWRKLFEKALGSGCLAFMLAGISLYLIRASFWGSHAPSDSSIGFPMGLQVPTLPWLLFLLYLCYFAIIANIWRIAEVLRRAPMSIGGFTAHLGVATFMAGMIISRGFELKQRAIVQQGMTGEALGYSISYEKLSSDPFTDRDNKAVFNVGDSQGNNFVAQPGFYFVPVDGGKPNIMTWPHIEHQLSHDVYLALLAPQFDVWQDPVQIKPGQSIDQNGVQVTYEKMVMTGTPGTFGAKFVAQLLVRSSEGAFRATPTMEVAEGGPKFGLARVGPSLLVSMQGLNPADHSALIQVHFAKPVYPFDVFYKPMTILVWSGAGILTFGGLLSAWYRRRPKTPPEPPVAPAAAPPEPKEDAVASVAQV